MFEKKVILIQLGIFVGLLLAIFTTFSLMANGVISREAISAFIVVEMFGTAIVGWTLTARYQRSKIFRPLIEDKLKDQGLIFVSERPLNTREIVGNLELAPAIAISDIPMSNFINKARNERMIHVKTAEGTNVLLHVVITKTWGNKIKLQVVKKTKIASDRHA